MQRAPSGNGRQSDCSQRLFFALCPDEATRRAIADAARAVRDLLQPKGGAVEARRYHLTLQFLGSFPQVPGSLIAQACRAASDLRAGAFELELDCLGSFNHRSVVWWLGCRTPPVALLALWDALGLSLARQGSWQQPAAFSPHVTIVRGAGSPIAAVIDPIPWPVRTVVLLLSRQVGGRSSYEVIGEWSLPVA